MYLNFYFIILLIYIFNKSYIYALKFQTHKVPKTFNLNNKIGFNLRNLQDENSKNKINLNFTNENLYYFNIEVGTPSQLFSILIDTGSNYFWINSNSCISCKSTRKFITDKSNTYNNTNKLINLNYISGNLKGTISSDIVKFNNNINISNFNFILVNESDINFELDGILGLSKNIKDFDNKELSPLNQIYKQKLFNNNIFTLDFPNKNFFIGEYPSYLNLYNNITCKRKSIYNLNNFYWKCIAKKIKFSESLYYSNSNGHNIIFNSGLNSMVFSLNYMDFFKNVISNNKLLNKAKCQIKPSEENSLIYSLNCGDIINLINKEKSEYSKIYEENFLLIYFDNDKNSIIEFKLKDLYDELNKNFKLHFIDILDNTIIVGIPLFEKYIVTLNQDTDEIIIYNNKRIIYNSWFNRNILIKISIIIIVICSILILIFFKFKIRKNKYNSIKLEKDFSKFILLTPEGTHILK